MTIPKPMAKKKIKNAKDFAGDFREKSIVSHRFMEAYNKLKQKGEFDSYDDFAGSYGYGKDVMANIATGRQEVPIILLWGMIVDYGVDANFFFEIKKELLRKQ